MSNFEPKSGDFGQKMRCTFLHKNLKISPNLLEQETLIISQKSEFSELFEPKWSKLPEDKMLKDCISLFIIYILIYKLYLYIIYIYIIYNLYIRIYIKVRSKFIFFFRTFCLKINLRNSA